MITEEELTITTLKDPFQQGHIRSDILGIGYAACASASAAMIISYHGKIGNNQESMIETAETVFNATFETTSGLLGRNLLEDHLEQVWEFSSVYFDDSCWDDLYETSNFLILQCFMGLTILQNKLLGLDRKPNLLTWLAPPYLKKSIIYGC